MTLAIWCLLAAALLPIITVGFAKRAGGRYDNHDPRARAASYEGNARRAYAAHQNGYESFPFFAAAVLIAEMKGVSGGAVGILAVVHVVARVGYVIAYVCDKPSARSLLWGVALIATIAIFTSPAWR